MSFYRAYLFDLDGTLVDSAPDLHATLNTILEEEGCAPVTLDAVRAFIGEGARRLLERSLNAQGESSEPARLDRLLERYLTYYERHIADHSEVYPEVRETLIALQAAGAGLAVVTNKFEHLAQQVLDALELSPFFPVVLGGDSLPERKPSAAPLLEACSRLGVAAEAALMVGDSRTDIAAARAAKISVLCVPYGYNHGEPIEAAGADGIIPNLSALLERS